MTLHIEKSIKEYRSYFLKKETKIENTTDNAIQNQVDLSNKQDKFARFFFVEMNEAVFSGEYLLDNYIEKLKEFEDILANDDSAYSYKVRESINFIKEIVFLIQNKTQITSDEIFMAINTFDDQILSERNSNIKLFDSWEYVSLQLLFIDHFLIKTTSITKALINISHKIEESLLGLDNKEIVIIYNKLKSKCSFLLKKVYQKETNSPHKYSVDFKIKDIFDDIKEDEYNKSFYRLYDSMVNKKIDKEVIKNYQKDFYENKFSSIGFVVLAYYYGTSEDNMITKLESLILKFDEYIKGLSKPGYFDKYALNTIRNYLNNCRFSALIKQKGFEVGNLKREIIKIEAIQDETNCSNYHPYKKALIFLDNLINNNDESEEIKDSSLSILYNDIFKKYKYSYEKCIQNNFYPFQLILKDCMTDIGKEGIFIASSLAKPISPKKLKDSEREFRDNTQYLKVRLRLSYKEKELKELTSKFESFKKESSQYIAILKDLKELASKFESFRKESFQYIGIFIAIITFLLGSIQIFAKVDQVPTDVMLKNITSLGLVLILFMTLLYIIVDKRKNKLLYLSLLALALLIILSFCL